MDQNVEKKDLDTEGQGEVSEEDIDLEDLEEVTETNVNPVNVEIPAPGPSQLMQVNLPLSQILTSSHPSSSPPSDQVHQEYQEICSFFYWNQIEQFYGFGNK